MTQEVRKFITVIDTVFEGKVAGWREGDGKPCLFDTREGAEKEAADIQIPEEDRDEDWEPEEPDAVIEVIVTDDKIYDPVDGRIYWQKGDGFLKKGTVLCPNDKRRFHWELFAGMRVTKDYDGIKAYSAKCFECGEHFKVRAD